MWYWFRVSWLILNSLVVLALNLILWFGAVISGIYAVLYYENVDLLMLLILILLFIIPTFWVSGLMMDGIWHRWEHFDDNT